MLPPKKESFWRNFSLGFGPEAPSLRSRAHIETEHRFSGEEMNRDFVSKEDLKRDMERMMDSLDNINKKIDDFLLSNQK